jgi:hypothetical protein
MRFLNTCLALSMVASLSTACGTKKDGGDQADGEGPAQELTAEEKAGLDAEFSKIPQAAIVRVKLDDEGNPTGSPEMKVAKGDATGLTTADAAAAAFEGGAAPESVVGGVDELDSDTSVQSWTNWGDGNDFGNQGDQGDFGQSNQNYYPGQQGPGQQNGGYKPVPQNPGQQYPGQQGPGGYKPPHQGGGQGGGSCAPQRTCGCQRSYCHDYWYVGYRPVLFWHGYGWNYGIGRPWYYRHGGYGYYCYRPRRTW